MERQRIVLDGWPALMSSDLAARYLSVDDDTFRRLAAEYRLEHVDLQDSLQRWRKSDLDRLIRRLPVVPAATFHSPSQPSNNIDIDKLAAALARHMAAGERQPTSKFLSIKDTCRVLGLGRTTVYALIKAGRLQAHQIGRRTLIPRTSVDALVSEGMR